MDNFLTELEAKYKLQSLKKSKNYDNEVYIEVEEAQFNPYCLALHKELVSTVMTMFAEEQNDHFVVCCGFVAEKFKTWIFVTLVVAKDKPEFPSLARQIYAANLFEREIKEMYGLQPVGNPDGRRLRLHDEVWPQGSYPLRKDFEARKDQDKESKQLGAYNFAKVDGEGIFEVPVGPVHAGIIGPGHFRFSVAGEPIINLEIRLGFTHRGIEKLMEGKSASDAVKLSEVVSGVSSMAHSWAFCQAVEKICGVAVPKEANYTRAIYLELERMYNHLAGIGGIALDVGFSQASALASILKESIHQLNGRLTGSRFLKGANLIGGVSKKIGDDEERLILGVFSSITKDFEELKTMLNGSVSFLDRVDTTGWLKKKTAEDFGVLGLAGRASGINFDLRQGFIPAYDDIGFREAISINGDVRARLNVRLEEFEFSMSIIRKFLNDLLGENILASNVEARAGFGLGAIEGARGPVLYWLRLDKAGKIERCKIVDPSFRSWLGLSYAVLDNIIPDFPACNKSFDLSYAGNDL
jgi:Ni,Fe-hydrogenase III large subunit/Ni,Fe-hydrogenase III component G